jgi:hypothetical protein
MDGAVRVFCIDEAAGDVAQTNYLPAQAAMCSTPSSNALVWWCHMPLSAISQTTVSARYH